MTFINFPNFVSKYLIFQVQYNDIRQTHGFKNVLIANIESAVSRNETPPPFIAESETTEYNKYESQAKYLWLVVHELLGHGTGQMMVQKDEKSFNFDPASPPISPVTGRPIESWYKPGQTWNGVFGNLATTVDECRCELVGACLLGDKDLLKLFGIDENSALRPEDREQNPVALGKI